MTFLLSPFLGASCIPFDNAQLAFDSPQEAIAPHGDHVAAERRSRQPTLPAAGKRLSERIVARDERIVFGDGVADRAVSARRCGAASLDFRMSRR